MEKAAFIVSLAVLIWLYGFATSAKQWFPNDFLVRAWREAQALVPSPHAVLRVYDREGARTLDSAAIQPGLTLIASWWKDSTNGSWRPGLRLVDANGRTHHRWVVDVPNVFPESAKRRWGPMNELGILGSLLLPNGDVLVNIEYVGTARLDACGRVMWKVLEHDHHTVARADDGTFWIPGVTRLLPPKTLEHPKGLPGLPNPVYHDLLLHVDGNGKILNRVDVLDILYDNDLQRYIPRGGNEDNFRMVVNTDVTHLNDIEPLADSLADEYPLFEAGDLLVSLRNLSLVFVVDPVSWKVKWHAWGPFFHQHDPHFMGGGWIGILDNNQDGTRRGTMLGGSRVVAVKPGTDSTRVLFPGPHSDPFYTRVRGEWQLLANGNLLLTETLAGRIAEVAPDGRTVWDWVSEPYRGKYVSEVPGATRYDLTAGEVASWPCSPRADGEGGSAP